VEVGDGVGYALAEALAARVDADAFVVRGPVDEQLLRTAADRRRLVVRGASADPPA